MYRKNVMLVALWLVLGSESTQAGSLTGRVINIQDGKGLISAAVSLDRGTSSHGASVVTVFTNSDGRYEFPSADVDNTIRDATVSTRLLGYRQLSPLPDARQPVDLSSGGVARVDFVLEPKVNVADDVPASAWLRSIPESKEKHATVLHCVGCHQFPTQKVRHFSEQVETVHASEALDQGQANDRNRGVRKEAWRNVIRYMRARSYDIFPQGTAMQIENVSWNVVQDPNHSLFDAHDEESISGFLSENLPRNFSALRDYPYGAPLGTLAGTVIREYRLPQTSNVREVTAVRGSPYYFGVDIENNRILKLHPTSGEQSWIDIPSSVATGPHTIVPDRKGDLWIAMLESDRLARYEPRINKWTFWSLKPTNVDSKAVFGGQAMVHDIAFDANYELARDPNDNIWLSLIGMNKMASLNTKTGYVRYFDALPTAGRNALNISLYGTLLSPDGQCAWYSQLWSGVACFNTKMLRNESQLALSEGDGPRRMAIDEGHTLWIPLFGSGQLIKYDTKARRQVAVYDLPDRASAPYSVTWDPRRQVVWVGTSNADVIYEFNPKTERFAVFPFPRQGGYTRRLGLDYTTGDVVTTYANIPTGSGPSMIVTIHLPE
jgi:streptogramin lyase